MYTLAYLYIYYTYIHIYNFPILLLEVWNYWTVFNLSFPTIHLSAYINVEVFRYGTEYSSLFWE